MPTTIKITPPGKSSIDINAFDSCCVNLSITERSGSFSITLPFLSDTDISDLSVGTDVQINQDGNIFRGFVIRPPKKNYGIVKTVTLEGADYTAKTQKILVAESYIDTQISSIVNDLFLKYVPWAQRTNINICSKVSTIKFPDVFLWDAMEQLCQLSGFDWYIDKDLNVNFFETANSVNQNIISESLNNYAKGSADFTPDATKLVNKLWIKGATAMSLPFTQSITVSGITPIPLYYKPRVSDNLSAITVTIGGVNKTLGIQNIDSPGTKDFVINPNEKLLIPDMCTSGTGTITYCYEYPVKIVLENEASKSLYGVFEDVITIDTNDKSIAKEIGSRYLDKYSKPVLSGSVEPFDGIYSPGELIKVEIQSLGIDEYLVVKEVSYESIPTMGRVNRKLCLESVQKDLATILKDMNQRLNKIETALFGTSEDVKIEKYKVYKDSVIYPKMQDDGISFNLHQYKLCGAIKAGTNQYI